MVFLVKYWKYFAAVAAALVFLYGVYSFGYSAAETKGELALVQEQAKYLQKVVDTKLENERLIAELSNKYFTAAELFEMDLSNLKTQKEVIKDVVIKEIEKPVYNECLLDADGLRIHKDARDSYNSSRN